MNTRNTFALYARSFIFGVEDSLFSTTGLLAGIAAAGVPRAEIFLTGIILIFVEAFSMAVGSFLSEQSSEEYLARKEVKSAKSLHAGTLMFIAYMGAGVIPLAPYLLLEMPSAFVSSIILSLIALFALGIASAQYLHIKILKSALRMLVIGGGTVLIGILVGQLVNNL
jgi:VIT1/CCC1 family predicted Fe2+/Mn2+ transporter